jgi:hypothetical protein
MSTLVFQATRVVSLAPFKQEEVDHDDLEAAKAWVEESFNGGRVVTFVKERNLPFCQPEFVLRSCALIVLDQAHAGGWRGVNIF